MNPECIVVLVHTDSDWAGCARTRKSTSCTCITIGGCLILQSATTQAIIALSSGEAEFHALVKSCARGRGIVSLLADFGFASTLKINTDSNAAIGITSRRGVGKVRHLHTPLLWVQAALESGSFALAKVGGKSNCADLATKHLAEAEMLKCLTFLNCRLETGSADAALRAAV